MKSEIETEVGWPYSEVKGGPCKYITKYKILTYKNNNKMAWLIRKKKRWKAKKEMDQ